MTYMYAHIFVFFIFTLVVQESYANDDLFLVSRKSGHKVDNIFFSLPKIDYLRLVYERE